MNILISSKEEIMRSTFINLVLLLLLTFFNSNAMDCSDNCKNEKNYKKCVLACLVENNHRIFHSSAEAEARKEWNKRYPCPPGEESDCYYPYRGDYKEGIKRDDEKRARWDD